MTQVALGRRAPRRTTPVDAAAFAADVEAALSAFRHDVSYAVSMARSAVTITRKREVWQARKETRLAEECARQ